MRSTYMGRHVEIDIDFRVSGLPHAVVKEAEHLRFQELFKLCETIPMQLSKCLINWNQGIVSWLKANPANIFTNGDWMLSQSRTTSSRRCDLVVLSTAKLWHKKSILRPTMRRGDVSKRNLKEFTLTSQKTQHIVICSSKLAGLRRSAPRCTKLVQENHSYRPSSEEFERYKKFWFITLNKSGRNAPMKLQSDFREFSTMNLEKSDLNQHLSINTKNAFVVFFIQYLMLTVE